MPHRPYGQGVSAEALPSIERASVPETTRAAVFHGREQITLDEHPIEPFNSFSFDQVEGASELFAHQWDGVVKVAIRP